MSKIVIFSAASEGAAANLHHSVIEGVDLSSLGDSRMFAQLESRAENESASSAARRRLSMSIRA